MSARKKYIAAAILTTLISMLPIVCAFSESNVPAQVAERYTDIEVTYKNTHPYVTNETTGFVYSDSMLLQSSDGLSTDMAKASVAMAMAAYNESHATAALNKMGFEVVCGSASYATVEKLTIYDCDHVAYLIGRKVIGDCVAYCVPVKGTTANAEWFSDFDLGTTGKHKGFYAAAKEVQDELYALLDNDKFDKEHTIIWTTGHSRGAAVSNIIAGELTDSEKYAAADNIFSYNFACPSVSKNITYYYNIYNFNGAGDIVPALPLTDWGYGRYGQTILLHRTEDENFMRRFEDEIGNSFSAAKSTGMYTDLFTQIIKNEKAYHEPTIRLAVMYIAWDLGGKSDATLEEVLEFSGYHLGDLIWDLAHACESITELTAKVSSSLLDLNTLIDFCRENSASIMQMTQVEFDSFMVDNLSTFNTIEHYVDFEIENQSDFAQASNLLVSIKEDCSGFGDVITSFANIYFGPDGNPKDGIGDGHTQSAYVLAVNSKYYGYAGWKDSSESRFYLPNNCTTIGAHCFRNCENIMRMDFGSELKAIGTYAFHGCSGMEELYIPNNIVYIGKVAFGDCTSVNNVTMPIELSKAAIFTSNCAVERLCYNAASTGIMPDRDLEYNFNEPDYFYEHTLEFFSRRTLREVVFEEGIVHIGNYAFYNAREPGVLASVSLPSTLKSVGAYAFYDQPELTGELRLPEEFTTLGEYAFFRCGFTSAVLPYALIEYPAYCFAECVNMDTDLPDATILIGDSAFYKCAAIDTLTIPTSVRAIGARAFADCEGITEITLPVEFSVAAIFQNVCNVETIHYTLGGDGIMVDRSENPFDGNCSLSDTLEWYSHSNLKYVDFEEGITRIGNHAFYREYRDGALETLVLPSTLESIGEYAFYNHPNLMQALVLPEGLTELGKYTFYNCGMTALTIPTTLSNIPERCFEGCKNFDTLIIPTQVTSIGDYAFWNCSGVKHVEIPVERSKKYVLNSPLVEDILYTAGSTGVMPDRMRDKWGNDTSWTLEGNAGKALKSVEFAEGVTHIGDYAFAFGSQNGMITDLKLPSTLQSIGKYAFSEQKDMSFELVLPEGMTQLGEYCFYKCGFTGLKLPASLLDYSKGCFEECTSIKLIQFPNAPLNIGEAAFKNCDAMENLVIPDGVLSIGRNAFENLDSIQTLTIPAELSAPYTVSCNHTAALETIRYTAGHTGIMPDREDGFPYMSTVEYSARSTLKTIIFDEGVKHIGSRAFWHDTDKGGLENIILPSTMESIGDYAFFAQPKLTGPIVLPEGFMELGAHAFDRCSALTAITLPSTLKEIPDWCFHFCGKLCTQLPEGLTRIGASAFETCRMSDDGKLVIPRSVEYIGPHAFLYSDNITEITLPVELDAPNGINLNKLETINYVVGSTGIMPDRSAEDDAENHYFTYMENKAKTLVSVYFEEGTKHIGAYAFYNNRYTKALKELHLPSTIETIGDYAFYNREGLKPVTFPAGLKQIGTGAFKNCIILNEITFKGAAPVIGEDAFAIGWDTEISAYYRPALGGWTEDVMRDYGNPITWIAIDDAFMLSHESIALVLSEQDFGDSAQLVFTVNDENVTIDAVWTSSDDSVVSVTDGLLTARGEGTAAVTAAYNGLNVECEIRVWDDIGFLSLPAMIELVDAEAFANASSIKAVALNDQVKSIGKNAFAGCENLLFINIPDSVSDIDETAFAGCGNLQIFCNAGSAAEGFAALHGIPCALIPCNQ